MVDPNWDSIAPGLHAVIGRWPDLAPTTNRCQAYSLGVFREQFEHNVLWWQCNRARGREVIAALGLALRGCAVTMILTGLLTTLALWRANIPSPLGSITALFLFVPYLGAVYVQDVLGEKVTLLGDHEHHKSRARASLRG